MRKTACLVFMLGLAQVQADMPPLAEKDAVIAWTLEQFWGNAHDSSGLPIQPSSDLDRRTVPVPSTAAYRALEAGEISGLAEWCGLKWERHFLALTAAARKRGMSDKQVAFLSVLHGVAQNSAIRSRTTACSEGERKEVGDMLEVSRKSGLEAPEKALERKRET
jgi:hypothetical protein